jgi:hypothetical protein
MMCCALYFSVLEMLGTIDVPLASAGIDLIVLVELVILGGVVIVVWVLPLLDPRRRARQSSPAESAAPQSGLRR